MESFELRRQLEACEAAAKFRSESRDVGILAQLDAEQALEEWNTVEEYRAKLAMMSGAVANAHWLADSLWESFIDRTVSDLEQARPGKSGTYDVVASRKNFSGDSSPAMQDLIAS